MEFIMLCYPVREVMLWQSVGNPDCLVSHRVVSRFAAVEAVVTCVCLGKGRPNLEDEMDENTTELQAVSAPVIHISLKPSGMFALWQLWEAC